MKIDVRQLLKRHRVSVGKLAEASGRTVSTVENWCDGTYDPPGYVELAIKAAALDLKPLTDAEMMATANVAWKLGVSPSTFKFWRLTGQFPGAAKLAAAFTKYTPQTMTARDRELVGRVLKAGSYFYMRGTWRARPVLGKASIPMRHASPNQCIAKGLLEIQTINGIRTLKATQKGKDLWYGNK